MRKTAGFFLGLSIFVLFVFFVDLDPSNPSVSRMAGIAGLMAIWWMTEALPIPATSLLPLVLVPALGIMLLFGGGFALAASFVESGLASWIGGIFETVDATSPPFLILGTSFGMTFLTELTSNTAITELVLPIIASASVGLGFNPLLLMIPATISASCAFMLPVATPPNAIIFGSKMVPMGKWYRSGSSSTCWVACWSSCWFTCWLYRFSTLYRGSCLRGLRLQVE